MARLLVCLPQAAPAVVLLAGLLSCAAPAMAGVIPGDVFDVDVAGFNSAETVGYLLTPDLQVTFGTSQTFVEAGINGQNITVSSSEVVGATTTSDTFIISTPVNFLTTATINGNTISELQFDIGDGNAGGEAVAFSSAIMSATLTGFTRYGSTNFTLAPQNLSAAGGLSLSAVEGVGDGTGSISGFDFNEFEMVLTYANPVAAIPEPSAIAIFAAGLVGLMASSKRPSRIARCFRSVCLVR